MLSNELKGQLSQYLNYLEGDLVLEASLDDGQDSKEMKEFLTEVAELSPRISFAQKSHSLVPSFEILRENESKGIRFAGIPLGHEFESFVLTLIQVSGRPPRISEEDVERIKAIDEKLEFTTFVSLTCHNCPEVVQALNIMSVINPNISHTMIEGGMFNELADEHNIMAVPTVFKNGEAFHGGRIAFSDLVDKIVGSKAKSGVDKLGIFDVLIVGGGPAAGSAAIYSARKGIKTGLICKDFGGQVNETLGIENIIGTKYTEGPKYMAQVKEHVKEYDVKLIEGFEAKEFKKEENGNISVILDNGEKVQSKTLIIATGARWRLLGIPGETELKNKGVAYCPHCDGPLFKGKKVAVIGGGNSGIEAAIDLASMAKEIVVVEFADNLSADKVLQDKLKSLSNVQIITSAQTTSIDGDDKVTGLTYLDRKTNEEHHIDLEGAFILVGLVPNTEWTRESLQRTRIGEIIVNKDGSTNIEGIFAAGDCTDQMFKQIVISIGSGATAALGAFNYLMRQ